MRLTLEVDGAEFDALSESKDVRCLWQNLDSLEVTHGLQSVEFKVVDITSISSIAAKHRDIPPDGAVRVFIKPKESQDGKGQEAARSRGG